MKLRLNSAKAEAQASSLSLAELGKIQSYDQPWISQKLKKWTEKGKEYTEVKEGPKIGQH